MKITWPTTTTLHDDGSTTYSLEPFFLLLLVVLAIVGKITWGAFWLIILFQTKITLWPPKNS